MAMHFRALFFAVALSGQLAAQHHLPFDASHHPIAPDYSQEKYLSALPFRKDDPGPDRRMPQAPAAEMTYFSLPCCA